MYERPKLTLEESLKIQADSLANWKTKLNPECYNDLYTYIIASNEGKTDPYSIERGSDLNTFVMNWKPNIITIPPSYILAYTLSHHDGNSDHFEVIRGAEDSATECALERYEELLNIDNIYSASLCEVIKSTDY